MRKEQLIDMVVRGNETFKATFIELKGMYPKVSTTKLGGLALQLVLTRFNKGSLAYRKSHRDGCSCISRPLSRDLVERVRISTIRENADLLYQAGISYRGYK